MKFFLTLFSLLLFVFTSSLTAQITGTVVSETGAPLDYATLSLYNQTDSLLLDGSITDIDGKFSIDAKPGEYYIQVDFLAYQTRYLENIKLTRGQKTLDLGTIQLQPGAEQLSEFTVEAERSSMEMKLDKRVFNVGKDLSSRGGTANDLLDNVPSVQVDVEGNVSLRGSGSVRILINGRPSGLVGDGGQGLRNLQANMIERVEVITNPSARYEAEGAAGIINIVLKKDQRKGFNGSFDVVGGLPETYGASANLNYRSGRLNWFTNYGINYRTSIGGGSLRQEVYRSADSTFLTLQESDRDRAGLNHNFRVGADYFFGEKTTLTGAFRYNIGEDDNLNVTRYDDFLNDTPLGYSFRTDNEIENEEETEFSLVFRKQYDEKDREWTADVRYQDELETEGSDLRNEFFDPEGNPDGTADLLQRSDNSERNKSWIFQTDYVHPFGEDGRWEAGARVSLRDITNDFSVQEFIGGEFQTLPELTNDFLYDENIYAAYLMYGNAIGKFSYIVGIRPEYTDVVTELKGTNEINPREYFNWFPSATLGYEFSETGSMQLSYSRRVRRPRFRDLNPFFTFSDNRNFFSGNPDLDPEFSHNFETGYLHILEKGSIFGGIYYRNTTGVIERIRRVDDEGNSTTRPENLATENSYGIEFNGNIRPNKWWTLNADFNFFRAITSGGDEYPDLDADTYTWFTRGTSRFNIGKQTDAQIRFNYRAPRNTPQGSTKSITSIDLAASQDVLKGSGTLTLSVRDLLNSRRRRYTVFGDNFFSEGDFQWRGTTATLTFSYRLNQKKQRGGRGGGGYDGGGEGEF